jgi:hypothetical protein
VAVWLARAAGLRGANGSALCPLFPVGSRSFRTWCWIRADPWGRRTAPVPASGQAVRSRQIGSRDRIYDVARHGLADAVAAVDSDDLPQAGGLLGGGDGDRLLAPPAARGESFDGGEVAGIGIFALVPRHAALPVGELPDRPTRLGLPHVITATETHTRPEGGLRLWVAYVEDVGVNLRPAVCCGCLRSELL